MSNGEQDSVKRWQGVNGPNSCCCTNLMASMIAGDGTYGDNAGWGQEGPVVNPSGYGLTSKHANLEQLGRYSPYILDFYFDADEGCLIEWPVMQYRRGFGFDHVTRYYTIIFDADRDIICAAQRDLTDAVPYFGYEEPPVLYEDLKLCPVKIFRGCGLKREGCRVTMHINFLPIINNSDGSQSHANFNSANACDLVVYVDDHKAERAPVAWFVTSNKFYYEWRDLFGRDMTVWFAGAGRFGPASAIRKLEYQLNEPSAGADNYEASAFSQLGTRFVDKSGSIAEGDYSTPYVPDEDATFRVHAIDAHRNDLWMGDEGLCRQEQLCWPNATGPRPRGMQMKASTGGAGLFPAFHVYSRYESPPWGSDYQARGLWGWSFVNDGNRPAGAAFTYNGDSCRMTCDAVGYGGFTMSHQISTGLGGSGIASAPWYSVVRVANTYFNGTHTSNNSLGMSAFGFNLRFSIERTSDGFVRGQGVAAVWWDIADLDTIRPSFPLSLDYSSAKCGLINMSSNNTINVADILGGTSFNFVAY